MLLCNVKCVQEWQICYLQSTAESLLEGLKWKEVNCAVEIVQIEFK